MCSPAERTCYQIHVAVQCDGEENKSHLTSHQELVPPFPLLFELQTCEIVE